jgi:hypothetical protein
MELGGGGPGRNWRLVAAERFAPLAVVNPIPKRALEANTSSQKLCRVRNCVGARRAPLGYFAGKTSK